MGKPEYLTTDWLDDLGWKSRELRREIEIKQALVSQLDELRHEFDRRIGEHEKWRDKGAEHHTEEQLQAMSQDDIIKLVLDLQERARG
jgi:hypothetical protein